MENVGAETLCLFIEPLGEDLYLQQARELKKDRLSCAATRKPQRWPPSSDFG